MGPGGSGGAGGGGGGPTTAPEIHALPPLGEYRFSVAQGSTLTVRLASGNAERDGTELAPGTAYALAGALKSKINTWHGCILEVSAGAPGANIDAHVADPPPSPEQSPSVSYLNLHFKLEGLRSAVTAAQKAHPHAQTQLMGPRIMVVGGPGTGKSTLVRTLTGWATRMGRQPLAVNLDPREGVLALPGTLSAAVFATLSDPAGAGWSVASTPMSRPRAVPPKLPLAYHYGLATPAANPRLYRAVCGSLAAAATARLAEDPDVRAAGMIIDTPACPSAEEAASDDNGNAEDLEAYYGHMAHVAAEFSANIIIVLGGERAEELGRRLSGRRTTLGEPVQVVGLDSTIGGGAGGPKDPITLRDAAFLQAVRERAIREYFFGDARNTLSPYTQQVEFDALSIWKVNSGMVFFPSFHFSLELYFYKSRLICLSSCTGIYAYTCICNADAA